MIDPDDLIVVGTISVSPGLPLMKVLALRCSEAVPSKQGFWRHSSDDYTVRTLRWPREQSCRQASSSHFEAFADGHGLALCEYCTLHRRVLTCSLGFHLLDTRAVLEVFAYR